MYDGIVVLTDDGAVVRTNDGALNIIVTADNSKIANNNYVQQLCSANRTGAS